MKVRDDRAFLFAALPCSRSSPSLCVDNSGDPAQRFFKTLIAFVQSLQAAANDNTKRLQQVTRREQQLAKAAQQLQQKQAKDKRRIQMSVRLKAAPSGATEDVDRSRRQSRKKPANSRKSVRDDGRAVGSCEPRHEAVDNLFGQFHEAQSKQQFL